jgi:hypothetical protein
MQVVHVARYDGGVLAPGDQDDGRIDDVRCRCASAERSARFGKREIERRNDRRRSAQQGAEPGLARAIAPGLTDDAGGDDDADAELQGFSNQRAHPGIGSLESDERPGV